MRMQPLYFLFFLLLGEALAFQQFKPTSLHSNSFLDPIPTKVLILCSVVLITCVWLGCAYFMASRHQKAAQYLQRQIDELWLLQAKPSVWPHAPFIPNPRENNPPEYIPPQDPQEQEQEDTEEQKQEAERAKVVLEARNNE
ncbi:uncharacterized protein LOC108086786 [Drosophila ficusphila]|uniref:uncharacterized protein LOC108086786 n=1 Tax=Drosophila ficusphila TaxID=30025 RepID=UPI0007E85B09|nr:uncharacterized protein LOC108086786 [Drosophila ficusphila]